MTKRKQENPWTLESLSSWFKIIYASNSLSQTKLENILTEWKWKYNIVNSMEFS